MIYGARKKQEFWVDVSDPESLKALKDAIYDDDYYTRDVFDLITVKGTFDSNLICKPCSDKRRREIYCIPAQATASERPFAIVCTKCGINYMVLIQ